MTHDTREEIAGALARGYCSKENKNKVLDSELIEAMALEVEKVLHQQLQKAHHDWLREEIVKLDGIKEEEELMYGTEDDVEYLTYRAGKAPDLMHKDISIIADKVKCTTLQTIIDRYHSELNQDKK